MLFATEPDANIEGMHTADLAELADELFSKYLNMKAGRERRELTAKYNQVAELVNKRRNSTTLRLIH
jgi:hypothetical protein